jgi:hypothetical protein
MAGVLRRLAASHRTSFLLQCQRHYGNAYVQRMVSYLDKGQHAVLKKDSNGIPEEEHSSPDVQIPQGQGTPLPHSPGQAFEPIQPHAAGSLAERFEAGAEVETQVSQSKGRGSPLPDPVRAYMEPRFGVDFSQVHAHTGSDALHMNRDVGAQAFTHGSDIYFGAGHSPTNLALTAHELTHVVQQTGQAPLQTKKQEQPVAPLALRHLSNGVVLRVPQASTPCPTCAANQEDMVQRQAHQEGGAPSERGKGPLNFLIHPARPCTRRPG